MQSSRIRKAKRTRQRKVARATGLKVAPGDLETVQAFVNTAARRKRADELASPARLEHWLERRGLLDAGTALGETELRRALDLRRGLRALVLANSGAPLDDAALRRLEQAVDGGRLAVRFDSDGPGGFGPASGRFDDALAALVALAAAARLEGLWRHLKLCAASDCGRAFFDTSANRTGRWCSPQCGERMRAAAHRRRRR